MYKYILIFFFFLNFELHAEVIQNVEIKGNDRISDETIKVYGEIDLNKDYTNQKFPYSEFPNGIKITFFDKDKNVTIVTSNYAITYTRTNIVDLVGDVVINNHDGSVLKTSQLYWDPQQEWLFSEKKFSFKKKDYDIIGKRLDANRSFTIFNTGQLDGKVMVEESENETVINEN